MISFRTPDQPLPMENNPRKVFFGMFGQGDTNEERQNILKTTNSLLDYVQGIDGHPDAQARRRRPRARERLPGFGARDRAPRAEARGERQVAGRSARCAARSAGGFRRAPRRPVRDDRAGLADQSDPRRDDEDGRGSEHADVPEPRRPRGVPSDLALGWIPGPRRQPAEDPGLPHRGVREVRRAPQGHARRRRIGARQLDHPVRQQHGEQRRAQQRSAAAGADRPWRRPQGQPAPALQAGHAAREHPGDDARAARACRPATSRSSPTAPARSRRCDRRSARGCRAVARRPAGLALPRSGVSRLRVRRDQRQPAVARLRPGLAQTGRQPPQPRWQHAAAVGGLQRRRRRGEASAACRRRRHRSPTTTAPRR